MKFSFICKELVYFFYSVLGRSFVSEIFHSKSISVFSGLILLTESLK